jgi:PTS system ascorbate-specific IIB component
MGLGSALILRMTVDKAVKNLKLEADVEVADISTARGAGVDADIILTSSELAQQLGNVKGKIITIKNYVDVNEMTEKLQQALAGPA